MSLSEAEEQAGEFHLTTETQTLNMARLEPVDFPFHHSILYCVQTFRERRTRTVITDMLVQFTIYFRISASIVLQRRKSVILPSPKPSSIQSPDTNPILYASHPPSSHSSTSRCFFDCPPRAPSRLKILLTS